MAKKEWTDPFPMLKHGGNLTRRAERAAAPAPREVRTKPERIADALAVVETKTVAPKKVKPLARKKPAKKKRKRAAK